MRILFIHNAYQQRGGEDVMVDAEIALMRSAGHTVDSLIVPNSTILGLKAQIRAASNVFYSHWGYNEVSKAIKSFGPDIVHVHNFFPLISSSVFNACDDCRIPSIWTLHNYRIACANGFLLRNSRPCEDCIGRWPYPAVLNKCYRGSYVGSAIVAGMVGLHKHANTWPKRVTRYVVLTDFAKRIAIRAGVPEDRISIKPNFVDEPDRPARSANRSGYIFVGRLSSEKGIRILLEAWRSLPQTLTIVGDGPLATEVEAAAAQSATIRYVGRQSNEAVRTLMREAEAILIPSVWYENQPVTLIEAMATGTPVLASRLGALAELVKDGSTGFLFEPTAAALVATVRRFASLSDAETSEIQRECISEYRNTYSPDQARRSAELVYRTAIEAYRSSEGVR